MNFMQRKPTRIGGYDYSQNGAYFVTLCTRDRMEILSEIVGDDAHIVPKTCGKIAEKYIHNAPEVEKYVLMPDHIHMIIRLNNENCLKPEGNINHKNKVASIVRSIKVLTTKEIGASIFQRSYYDHVIRNQQDYNEIWEYIENNPRRWLAKKQGRN